MIYFSGFSLQNEQSIFSSYSVDNDYTVMGFSYGAQRAFEYIYNSKRRIDRLILISPATFELSKQSFIRTQLRYFQSNRDEYIKGFLSNVTYPSDFDLSPYLGIGTKDELEELLSYRWDRDRLQALVDRGVTIEVFVGSCDKIIDYQEAVELFSPYATIYQIKGVGHILI